MSFWLRYQGQNLKLHEGTTTLGRSSVCQIVLNDALASRQHASITVSSTEVIIEDLGSSNGVLVNGHKASSVKLIPFDVITIGGQELTLVTSESSKLESLQSASDGRQTQPDLETTKVSYFDVIGRVVDRWLSQNRTAEAEQTLRPMLEKLLATQEPIADELALQAASYSIKLGKVGYPDLLNYPIRLFTKLSKPLPIESIEALHGVRKQLDSSLLKDYLDVLHGKQFGPADKFLVNRIESLRLSLA